MAMAMNPEIKARWTAALRSGEYPQATGYLRTLDGYCCLGVLCDLAVKDSIIVEREPVGPGYTWEYGEDMDEILLPRKVREWAGLDESNPHIDPAGHEAEVAWETPPDSDYGGYLIANANDGHTPFSVIADIIDAQL